MRAIVYENYGPPGVLHLHEIEKPVLGNELVWEIEAKGLAVTRFKVGDQVTDARG